MNRLILPALALLLIAQSPAHATSERYRKQLEQSGCTQVSELQGCDIKKTKAQNAEAGFTHPTAADQPPYVGQWVAKTDAGARVASIRIDEQDNVWVNDTPVEAKRVDGVLQFRQGTIVYTIQGDRGLKNEDFWADSEAGTKGPIMLE
mgnify:FL=1